MPSCRLSSLLSVAAPILASASTSARGGREISLISGMASRVGLLISKQERADLGAHISVVEAAARASDAAHHFGVRGLASGKPDVEVWPGPCSVWRRAMGGS